MPAEHRPRHQLHSNERLLPRFDSNCRPHRWFDSNGRLRHQFHSNYRLHHQFHSNGWSLPRFHSNLGNPPAFESNPSPALHFSSIASRTVLVLNSSPSALGYGFRQRSVLSATSTRSATGRSVSRYAREPRVRPSWGQPARMGTLFTRRFLYFGCINWNGGRVTEGVERGVNPLTSRFRPSCGQSPHETEG